jgi:L-2-hydroxyglutarate oxidase LhgO
MKNTRAGKLIRKIDDSGVSGTGHVADFVVFENGKAVLCWKGKLSSIAVYNSIEDLESIHGHEGHTILVWNDIAEELLSERSRKIVNAFVKGKSFRNESEAVEESLELLLTFGNYINDLKDRAEDKDEIA